MPTPLRDDVSSCRPTQPPWPAPSASINPTSATREAEPERAAATTSALRVTISAPSGTGRAARRRRPSRPRERDARAGPGPPLSPNQRTQARKMPTASSAEADQLGVVAAIRSALRRRRCFDARRRLRPRLAARAACAVVWAIACALRGAPARSPASPRLGQPSEAMPLESAARRSAGASMPTPTVAFGSPLPRGRASRRSSGPCPAPSRSRPRCTRRDARPGRARSCARRATGSWSGEPARSG